MLSKRRFYKTDLLFCLFLMVQIALWSLYTRHVKPDFTIVPDVPSELAVKAMALGDEQFYFRTLALKMQNAGDTFGRFTALKRYDYKKLYHWFSLLDTLDRKSHFIPSLAGYYYSQTQNVPDVRYIVDYLSEHAMYDDDARYHKWWWLSQAVYLANHKLKDKSWALDLAYELAKTPRDDIPLWAKQMPAFILEQLNEYETALAIIANIVENQENLAEGEINFMHHFVTERLGKIEKENDAVKFLEENNTRKKYQ